jgi:hypothetical protein
MRLDLERVNQESGRFANMKITKHIHGLALDPLGRMGPLLVRDLQKPI